MDKHQNINLKIENKEVAQFGTMARIQMFFETVMSFLRLVLTIIVVGGVIAAIGIVGWAAYNDYQNNQTKSLKTSSAKNQPIKQTPKTASAVPKEPAIDLVAWRQIHKNLSPADVRRLLGEPVRIQGGNFSIWSYPNNGSVTFYKEVIYSWVEPQ